MGHMFPVAEKYSEEAISLPIHPGLTVQEQEKIVFTLREILR